MTHVFGQCLCEDCQKRYLLDQVLPPDTCAQCRQIQLEAQVLALRAQQSFQKMQMVMASANGPALREIYLKEHTALWTGNVRVLVHDWKNHPPKSVRFVGRTPEGYRDAGTLALSRRTAFSYFPFWIRIYLLLIIWFKSASLEKWRAWARRIGCVPLVHERRAQRRRLWSFTVAAGRWAAFNDWLEKMP